MPLRCVACGVRIKPDDEYCRRCGARSPDSEKVSDSPPTGNPTLSMMDHVRDAAWAAGRSDDEEVELWQGNFSTKAMFREVALVFVLTVGFLALRSTLADPRIAGLVFPAILGLWFLLLALLAYRKLDASYIVTNQRLLHQHGILYRRTHRIEVIDIDDLRYEQGIFERMLGVGRIMIDSSDASHHDLIMYGIDNVDEVFHTLESARRKERLQHGLHVEAI